MWVVYVCEFVYVNIYIYIMYICIYYYARECNDEDDVFFLFVCSDYPSRVCVRGPRVPLTAPCGTERRLVKILSLFFSFSSRKQK
jgi:hypothetical protein